MPFQPGDTPASVIELTFKTRPNQQAATEKYRDYPMGILELKKPGKHTIKVSLMEGDPETSSLESVHIYPIN